MILDQAYDLVPVEQLRPHPANPRRGDVDRIAESIDVNSFYGALIVQRSTGHVLAGNHRLLAAKQQGLEAVPVLWVDVDDEAAMRILLADNRTNDVATYDEQELVALLTDLDLTDVGLAGTGYSAEDLAALVGESEEVAQASGADDVPQPPAAPVSALGDLWLLGPHRLLCGDSTNPDDLDRVLADLSEPRIVYTDPPYGISIVSGGKVGGGGPVGGVSRGKVGGGKVVPSSDYIPVAGDESTDTAAGAFRLLFSSYPSAVHVWWGGNHYAASAGLPDASCWLVWDKENTGNFADAELAWTNHPGAVRLLRHMWNGMLRATERGKRVHPTQKPVALAEWAFSVVDPKAERRVVLDVFGGSGSTLMAAHATGRAAALIEMEPAYVDVICRRFQEHTGTKPVLQLTGEPHDFTT